MNAVKILFLLFVSASAWSATFYVDAGTTRFANTTLTLSNQVTITTSGSPSAQQRAFVYFDVDGVLAVSLPPGVTGSCTGAPCYVYTMGAASSAVYTGTSGAFPNTVNTPDIGTAVEPLWAASAGACAATTTPTLIHAAPEMWATYSYAQELGLRFTVTSATTLCGVHIFKAAGTNATTHTVSAWNSGGTRIATGTSSNEPSTGWASVLFSSPVSVGPGTYTVSYTTSSTELYTYSNSYWQNRGVTNGPIFATGVYGATNGSCDPSDAWPKLPSGIGDFRTAVGLIGCADINTDGSIAQTYWPGRGGSAGQSGFMWGYGNITGEGCQCMIGGVGPGPWAAINNFISGMGNVWHHDYSGGELPRGDYYYYRDWFYYPRYGRLGSPESDHFSYESRQDIEWKGGRRGHMEGMLFDGGWNDNQNSSLLLAIGNQNYGNTDFSITNSEFRHGAGLTNMGSQNNPNHPNVRNQFSNNLVWDLGGYASKYAQDGSGWLFQDPGGEDFTWDHNTVMLLGGWLSTIFYKYGNVPMEGAQVTNNLFPIANSNGNDYGMDGEQDCGHRPGESLFSCPSSPWINSVFQKNLLYPTNYSVTDNTGWLKSLGGSCCWTSNTTQTGIQNAYPTLKNTNYIPASYANALGFFATANVNSNNFASYPSGADPRVKSGSLITGVNAGAAYPSTDGQPLGADIQKIRDAQGAVEAVSVPNNLITTSSAAVVFNAPDSQACPVDYAVDNPGDPYLVGTFTRVADTGAGRTRQVNLTGLASKTTYHYRIDCAAFAPMGRFRTK